MADVTLPTQYPAIPEPTLDPNAMLRTLQLMKEAVELLCGTRTRNFGSLGQGVLEMRARADNLAATLRQVDEVQTANGEAIAQRTFTLEANYHSITGQLADTSARLTDVQTARASGDAALAQRATTLEAGLSDATRALNARLTQVDQARSDGDGALAARTANLEAQFGQNGSVPNIYAQLTAFQQAQATKNGALASLSQAAQATADQGTASGAVNLTATAGIGGTIATYSWNIAARGVNTGMFATVDGYGQGCIMFSSDRFRLYDPARGAVPVFDYSSGQFAFNSNVKIAGNLVVEGSINSTQIGDGAVSQIGAAASGGMSVGFDMQTFGGRLIILTNFNGAPGTRYPAQVNPGGIEVRIDGALIAADIPGIDSYPQPYVCYSFNPTSRSIFYNTLGPGVHRFSVQVTNAAGVGGVAITVMELRR